MHLLPPGAAGDFYWEIQWIGGVTPDAEETVQGTSRCSGPPQSLLRYNVSGRAAADYLPSVTSNESLTEAVCCDTAQPYPEPNSFFARPDVNLFAQLNTSSGVTTFYDSVCGMPLFMAPVGRTLADWKAETTEHGWPSFRIEEVVKQNM